MRLLFGFLLFLLVLVQATFISLPLTLIVISIMAIFWKEKAALHVFLLGLLLDILTVGVWGLHSLFFLGVIYLTLRYRKKIFIFNLLYYIFFILFITIFYDLIFFRKIYIKQELITVSLGILSFLIASKFFPKIQESNKRLEIN